MDKKTIQSKFRAMGAEVSFEKVDLREATISTRTLRRLGVPLTNAVPREAAVRSSISLDVSRGVFDIRSSGDTRIEVLSVDPKNRHLLIMALTDQGKERYLCGHDERDWFVAVVPGGRASTVAQAKEALKPQEAHSSQGKNKVKNKNKNKRKNRGYIRQGEWFFIPDDSKVDNKLILKNEPLLRGRGKPHMAEELVRSGGQVVYVGLGQTKGISKKEYESRLKDSSFRSRLWKQQILDPIVLVKGKIKHPDHATLNLDGWHRVVPNTENKAVGFENMRFID